MKKTIVLMIGLFLILALALTSCGWDAEPPQGSISATGSDETGGLDVIAQEAEEGSTVTGQVTVGEGECLMIGSAMEKGVFEVRATPAEQGETASDGGLSADPDATFDGSFITRLDLGAGEYLLSISVRDYVEENTTGKLTILPYQVDESDFVNGDVPVDLLKIFGMISPNGDTSYYVSDPSLLLDGYQVDEVHVSRPIYENYSQNVTFPKDLTRELVSVLRAHPHRDYRPRQEVSGEPAPGDLVPLLGDMDSVWLTGDRVNMNMYIYSSGTALLQDLRGERYARIPGLGTAEDFLIWQEHAQKWLNEIWPKEVYLQCTDSSLDQLTPEMRARAVLEYLGLDIFLDMENPVASWKNGFLRLNLAQLTEGDDWEAAVDLMRNYLATASKLIKSSLEMEAEVDRIIYVTKEGKELEVDLSDTSLGEDDFVLLLTHKVTDVRPPFKVNHGTYSFEPASGETAEFHGETAVLLEDAILTNCYSGMTDSIGRITWTNLPENKSLQQGDVVFALQESNGKTMVYVPTGDTPLALYGELPSDVLSQSTEDITQGNLADAAGSVAYDRIDGRKVETLSGYVRILMRENGWCKVQPLAGGDTRLFWIRSNDLSYSFNTLVVARSL